LAAVEVVELSFLDCFIRRKIGYMGTERIKVLAARVKEVIAPSLLAAKFTYEPATRTFRRSFQDCVQIINFQAGVRSLEGRFTVNLAIFHPQYSELTPATALPVNPKEHDCLMEFRIRLSNLRETFLTRLFRSKVSHPNTFLQWWLVTPSDKWWDFSANKQQVDRSLQSIHQLLMGPGLAWLDHNSNPDALKAAYEKRANRAAAVSNLSNLKRF
jgi:Domain of unknown function (DUF4304)